ncbi:MAG TPA: cupin domain-containing protein [Bauldia sp.]|nr:cupin domain-containing protein [Bauldia sp.]
MFLSVRILTTAALLSLPLAVSAAAEESVTYQNLLTPLLSTGETVIGQDIAYPGGAPKVTAAVVVIPPGGETGWHIHKVPLFVYILEGEVTVDYGEKGVKVIKAGETILEAMDWAHNGMNKTDKPVRILAVYIGADGVSNAEPAPAGK